jgi:hypothetical protein
LDFDRAAKVSLNVRRGDDAKNGFDTIVHRLLHEDAIDLGMRRLPPDALDILLLWKIFEFNLGDNRVAYAPGMRDGFSATDGDRGHREPDDVDCARPRRRPGRVHLCRRPA